MRIYSMAIGSIKYIKLHHLISTELDHKLKRIELIMDNYLIPSNSNIQRCPRCQHELDTIVVHGHEQCINIANPIYLSAAPGDTCETEYKSFQILGTNEYKK